jgi:ribonuclease HI
MKSKYYAVRKGRKPGIYTDWETCSAQVSGFPGAVYKSFESLIDARAFLKGEPGKKVEPVQPVLIVPESPARNVPVPISPTPNVDQADDLKQVTLYTDGGCILNPGPGGYGAVLLYEGRRKELSGGYRLTTNNRMELMACIVGLESLKERCAVAIVSDSRYLVNAMGGGSARRWKQQRWQRKGIPVPNADLWERLLAAADPHVLRFQWVRGHTGNPENERCDQLAMAAALRPNLPPDEGYKKGTASDAEV